MSILGIGYQNLSSGLKIYSAADDPSGLSIAKKMETQVTGYNVGADNASAGKDAIAVSEGALNTVGDSLQRMKELALKASNSAVMSVEEKGIIQDEIEQLKKGIQDAVKNTSFNTMKLLDGSIGDIKLATNPDGTGQSIKMVNSSLESLGIADFNVTGEFDVSVLDDAMEKITSGRSQLGAQYNALDYKITFNENASLNTSSSQSRIEDLDFADSSVERQKDRILEQYKLNMQKRMMEEDPNRTLINTLFR